MRRASAHDATQSMAGSRHRMGADPQGASSSISQVAEGGSAATASDKRIVSPSEGTERANCQARVSMPPQEMRAVATERMSRIKASMAVLGEEDTEELQFLQAAFEKALRQSKIPPVGHQINATEEFIGQAKKRLVQHDAIQAAQEFVRKAESLKEEEVKRLSEAEEVLQRLKVQAPVVPTPPPRSVEVLQQMVEQLQIERDALAGQVKHQNSTRMVQKKMHPMQGSEDAAQVVLERFAKRRALGEDIPTDQQDLEGWMVSKQLELRDALEMGEIDIIKELTQLLAKGALRMEGFPSMVSNMVM